MMRSLYTAASGMMAQQMNMDNISNNLANVQSTGFKKTRVDFQDLLYATMQDPGTEATAGTQIGMGVRASSTERMFSQGSLQKTSNPYDVAIQGDGFFKVTMPDGTSAYTRDGAFKYDGDKGEIVTSAGQSLGIAVPKDVIFSLKVVNSTVILSGLSTKRSNCCASVCATAIFSAFCPV